MPASGRTDPAPKLPSWVKLGKAGAAWWRWAWRTPQAAGWSLGVEAVVARRASLEDDLAALDAFRSLDVSDVLGLDGEAQAVQLVDAAMRRLHALAGGRVAIVREMRELDDRLGLTPKAMAALRWRIAAPDQAADGVVLPLGPDYGNVRELFG